MMNGERCPDCHVVFQHLAKHEQTVCRRNQAAAHLARLFNRPVKWPRVASDADAAPACRSCGPQPCSTSPNADDAVDFPSGGSDDWLDEHEEEPGGEGAPKYVAARGAGPDAVSVDSESMWSQLSLYGLLQGMPLAQATAVLRVIVDERFRPSAIAARRGEEVQDFMDEISKYTAREYTEQVLSVNADYEALSSLGVSEVRFRSRRLVEVLQILVARHREELLFDRISPEGVISDFIDGGWYADMSAKYSEDILGVIFGQDTTHVDRRGERHGTPFSITLGNLPMHIRHNSADGWMTVAYLPDLESVVDSCTLIKQDSTSTAARVELQQLIHRHLWRELRESPVMQFQLNEREMSPPLRCLPALAIVDLMEARTICNVKQTCCILCECEQALFREAAGSSATMRTALGGAANDARALHVPCGFEGMDCNPYEMLGMPDDLHVEFLGNVQHLLKAFKSAVAKTSSDGYYAKIEGCLSDVIINQDKYPGAKVPSKGLATAKMEGEEFKTLIIRLPVALATVLTMPTAEREKRGVDRQDIDQIMQDFLSVTRLYLEMLESRSKRSFAAVDLDAIDRTTTAFWTAAVANKKLAAGQKSEFNYVKAHQTRHVRYSIERFGPPSGIDTRTHEGHLKEACKVPGSRVRQKAGMHISLPRWAVRRECALMAQQVTAEPVIADDPRHAASRRAARGHRAILRGEHGRRQKAVQLKDGVTQALKAEGLPLASQEWWPSMLEFMAETYAQKRPDTAELTRILEGKWGSEAVCGLATSRVRRYTTCEMPVENSLDERLDTLDTQYARATSSFHGRRVYNYVSLRAGEEIWYGELVMLFQVMFPRTIGWTDLAYVRWMEEVTAKDSRRKSPSFGRTCEASGLRAFRFLDMQGSGGSPYGVVRVSDLKARVPMEAMSLSGPSGPDASCTETYLLNRFMEI